MADPTKGKKARRIAVFCPTNGATSETFIRTHIERLPFDVIPRYGTSWLLRDASGRLIWPLSWWIGAVIQKLAPKLNTLLFNFFMARHLRSLGVDAILAEYGTTGAYLVEACRKARVPLFVHFHGYDASIREVLESNRDAYRRMFDYASGVVAVSQVMKRQLLLLGAVPERLHLNPCGVDPDRFSGGNPAAASRVFLGVGRFVEKKAPNLTVLAFSKMVQTVPDARMIMVGEGPLLGQCKRLAAELGVESAIEFLGVQPPSRVNELMRGARAFVQHSREAHNGDSEGTPVAVIEAQMIGLPVISTRHAGIPDVVIDGETGFIVDEGDTEGMSVRMIEIALDPNLAGKLGRSARKRAEAHYTLSHHLSQLADMINAGIDVRAHINMREQW